jgi:hypothetical protein
VAGSILHARISPLELRASILKSCHCFTLVSPPSTPSRDCENTGVLTKTVWMAVPAARLLLRSQHTMASKTQALPPLPATPRDFVSYLARHPDTPIAQLVGPYRAYETKLRELFAQERDNPILADDHMNVVPVFNDCTSEIKTRARNISAEPDQEKQKYLMPLSDPGRRRNGEPAVVQSLKEFQHNFSVFSESSLADLNWNNVVVAGSSVVTSLLPVPKEYAGSRRSLREY